MAAKPPAQPTLEELARMEAATAHKREQARQDYADGQKKIAAETPERFLSLARQVRDGVRRFNSAAEIQRPVQYTESAAVTTRDPSVNGDFSFEVRRGPNQLAAGLREMGGPKSTSYAIEISGVLGVPPEVDRFRLRVDGLVRGAEIVWRMLCDGKPLDIGIDDLGDRLVMVIVTGQLARLWNEAPWHEPPRPGH